MWHQKLENSFDRNPKKGLKNMSRCSLNHTYDLIRLLQIVIQVLTATDQDWLRA